MKKVRVTVSLKRENGQVGTEVFETMADNSIINKSTSSTSRKELAPWAKPFFPKAEWVEVLSIQVL
jgi:hypothetical protein